MGSADIGHHGDAHSGETGNETTGGTDEEANSRGKIFKIADGGEEEEGDAGDGLELAVEIGGGSFLDSCGHFSHAVVSVWLSLDPGDETPSSGQADEACNET